MKLKPPVGGGKSLLISESLRLNRIISTIDSFRNESLSCCSETQNSAAALFFVGEMEQKQAIWCLKCKSLNINLLFFELLNYLIILID